MKTTYKNLVFRLASAVMALAMLLLPLSDRGKGIKNQSAASAI